MFEQPVNSVASAAVERYRYQHHPANIEAISSCFGGSNELSLFRAGVLV
jgi:hypothetical protein